MPKISARIWLCNKRAGTTVPSHVLGLSNKLLQSIGRGAPLRRRPMGIDEDEEKRRSTSFLAPSASRGIRGKGWRHGIQAAEGQTTINHSSRHPFPTITILFEWFGIWKSQVNIRASITAAKYVLQSESQSWDYGRRQWHVGLTCTLSLPPFYFSLSLPPFCFSNRRWEER
jgi:hypothetical protein